MIKRISWIDVFKGIGIILVILGHIYSDDNYINVWIYSFHMPMFFFISIFLYVYKDINRKEFYKNKFRSLIVPFLFFECLLYILVSIRTKI